MPPKLYSRFAKLQINSKLNKYFNNLYIKNDYNIYNIYYIFHISGKFNQLVIYQLLKVQYVRVVVKNTTSLKSTECEGVMS